MKAIILAAGQGNRLAPLTNDRPKCMVEYSGAPMIDHILDALSPLPLSKIVVVGGYKFETLKSHLAKRPVCVRENPRFAKGNMVATLFSVEDEMDDDLLISYSDIVYGSEVPRALAASEGPVSIVVDRKWESLWRLRMEDPLKDAETMKLSPDGHIVELGKKPKSMAEIQGQYIGMIRFSKDAVAGIRKLYHSLDKSAIYDGKDYENMYMTSFLQLIIDRLCPAKAVFIDGGWIEVDRPSDISVPLDWASKK